MPIATQLIGRTSAIKGGLFRIKERLKLIGVTVRYPLGDSVIAKDGLTYLYDPDEWTAYEMLLDFCESIQDTELHIVCNDIGGIVGREAALSTAFAMLHGKPIIITHKPYFRPNVDQRLVDIITRNYKKLNQHNIIKLDNTQLTPYIELIAEQKPRYILSKDEKILIRSMLRDTLNSLL